MTIIKVRKLDEAFLYVTSEFGIEQEMYEYFSFMSPGAKFDPRVRNRLWDGKIRLYSQSNKKIHVGLFSYIEKFARINDYQIQLENEIIEQVDVTYSDIERFVNSLNIHSRGVKLDVRDYQLSAIYESIKNKRIICVSPTSCLDPNTEIEVLFDNTKKSITLLELDSLVKNGVNPKINTPSGYEKITETYRKFGNGIEIHFEDNSTPIKAANNHLMYLNDNWIDSIDVKIGDDFGNKKVTKINKLEPQEWIDFSIDADHESYFHNDILHHNSGKSVIIYAIIRWYIEHNLKCLIIVPSTMLVDQMFGDFKDYSSHNGWNVDKHCNKIYSGHKCHLDLDCAISTWQTLQNIKHQLQFFENLDVLIGDESHLYKAAVVTKLLNNMPNTSIRIGTTGTLDGKQISELQLTGLFGKVYKVITTKELMDENSVTTLDISCILLNYDSDTKKLLTKTEYQKEIDWLVQNDKRNKFIVNLAASQQETTLVLFQYVEKHGLPLYKMLKEKCPDREIHYISGSVDNSKRDEIRNSMNTSSRMIKIWFGELYISVGENENVLLSNGDLIQSKYINENHDIDNNWIKSRKLNKL
jgi:superfamily II DNA or RNA helicase